MRLQLLELKAEMLRDGVRTIDLLEANIVVDFLLTATRPTRFFLVEDRHLARPDLIAFEMLGSANYVDVVLKYNQITNPFAMEVNDLIMVPPLVAVNSFYKKSESPSDTVRDTKSLFVDPSRVSQKDQARLKQLEKIASRSKNGSREVKPTNLLRSGEVPFKTDGTALRLAPNATRKK
jgi:hypothetical protein